MPITIRNVAAENRLLTIADQSAQAQMTASQMMAKQAAQANASVLANQAAGSGQASAAAQLSQLAAQQAEAQRQAEQARQQQALLASQLDQLKLANEQNIAGIRADYGRQLSDLSAGYDARISGLNDLLISTQASSQAQLRELESQRAAADAAYSEMRMQSENLGRAYVPVTQTAAAAPQVGDARSTAQAARPRRSNTLSSLSILSGLASTSPAMAGLQIA